MGQGSGVVTHDFFRQTSVLCLLLASGCTGQDKDANPTDSGGVSDCELLTPTEGVVLTEGVPYGEVSSEDPEVLFRHTMDVRTPRDAEGPLPVLIMIHGGGWHSGDSKNNEALSELYAQLGFAVFSINYTLSTTESASFPTNLQDVICAIQSVRHPDLGVDVEVDVNRIVLMGTSAGGHLSALAGFVDGPAELLQSPFCPESYPPARVDLVVDYFGPSDLSLSAQDANENNAATRMIGDDYANASNRWMAASPVSHVDANDPPILIAHGTADSSVTSEHSVRLHEAIQAAGGESTLVLVEDAEHGFHRNTDLNREVRCVLDPLMRELLDL